ncbi:MAG: WD40 repeat domain-containing protein [Gemmataceae bacterium]
MNGDGHGDEVLSCTYSPDSQFILSGGWDGCVRLWDAANGDLVRHYQVSNRPVTACAIAADGKHFLSGSLDGLLAHWDFGTGQPAMGIRGDPQTSTFLAHTRPISHIAYINDGDSLVTASWDSNLIIWRPKHEGRTLAGHSDIVTGCAMTPDSRFLLSWSHDKSVRMWDMNLHRQVCEFPGHEDRVLSGAVSPDGHWAITGGRDGAVFLWDLQARAVKFTTQITDAVNCCCFLLDGQALVIGEATGHLTLVSVPAFEEICSINIEQQIQCASRSPSGAQLAVGAGDGRIYLVAVDGFDANPLLVTVWQSSRRTASAIQKLFGKSTETPTYVGNCPACLAIFEMAVAKSSPQLNCPGCKRKLRVAGIAQRLEDSQ